MMAQKAWSPRLPSELRGLFEAEGLALMGVCQALSYPEEEARYRRWIEENRQGAMGYLERHAGMKYNPGAILEDCRSLLFVGLNYYQKPVAGSAEPGIPRGRFARYAWGRDYHKVLGKKLRRIVLALEQAYPEERFRAFTDTSPLDERFYAEKAGIAFTGKNLLSISSHYGSWFLLGEILSTRAFAPSEGAEGRHGGCPSGCVRCLKVCPTGALESPHKIDARRCISYLTIEHKGDIPLELRPLMGLWVFGCDLCQEVCPLNLRSQVTGEGDFLAWKAGPERELGELLTLRSEEEFLEKFAGSPVVRAGRRMMIRNACVAAGNSGARSLVPALERIATGEDELLAEHAAWALERIATKES